MKSSFPTMQQFCSCLTSYIIMGLEPGNRYTITVTVSNSAGTAPVSSPVTAMTQETGERERVPDTQWFVSSSTAPTGAPDGVSEVSVTASLSSGERCPVSIIMER